MININNIIITAIASGLPATTFGFWLIYLTLLMKLFQVRWVPKWKPLWDCCCRFYLLWKMAVKRCVCASVYTLYVKIHHLIVVTCSFGCALIQVWAHGHGSSSVLWHYMAPSRWSWWRQAVKYNGYGQCHAQLLWTWHCHAYHMLSTEQGRDSCTSRSS